MVDIKMFIVFYFNVNGQFVVRIGSVRGYCNIVLFVGGNFNRGQCVFYLYWVFCIVVVFGDVVCWNGGVIVIKNMLICLKIIIYISI